MNWRLSPSDLVFLYEECPRCFYLKVRGILNRPRTIMPKIFTTIDMHMKTYLQGKRTDGLAPNLPIGTFEYADRWVASAPLALPGCTSTCSFRGRFDNVVQLDSGNRALADLKTCHRRDEHIQLYSRQLHAYTWCLEHPAPGALFLGPIERMGLLVFEPHDFFKVPFCGGALTGRLQWVEIARDEEAFFELLSCVVRLLESPTPPPPAAGCAFCLYRESRN
jgi:hypothetical protein